MTYFWLQSLCLFISECLSSFVCPYKAQCQPLWHHVIHTPRTTDTWMRRSPRGKWSQILATKSQTNSQQCYHHTRPSEHLLFNAYQWTALAGLPFLLSGFPHALAYPVCISELYHNSAVEKSSWNAMTFSYKHCFLCRCLWISQSSAALNWAQLGLLWFLGNSMCLSSSLGPCFPRVNSSLSRHVPERTRPII